MKYKSGLRNLTLSALFLALCLLLPFLTGQIPTIGQALSPMHIPVLLCGFVCGWPWGLGVGFIAPLLRYLLFGMPPIYPTGLAVAFELATYGAATGIFYRLLPQRTPYIYTSLIVSMLLGRCVWGIARFIMAGLSGSEFSFAMFLSGAFTTAVPGIICHIIIVPAIVIILKKGKLIPVESNI